MFQNSFFKEHLGTASVVTFCKSRPSNSLIVPFKFYLANSYIHINRTSNKVDYKLLFNFDLPFFSRFTSLLLGDCQLCLCVDNARYSVVKDNPYKISLFIFL